MNLKVLFAKNFHWKLRLHKIAKFQLISWCGNLVETHSFRKKNSILRTRNYKFKKEIWDKFTEFTFLKFWNLPRETREI